MTLVGCDLHSRKQQVAVLDTRTGEFPEQELAHAGDALQAIALNPRLALPSALWTRQGLTQLKTPGLPPHSMRRRDDRLALVDGTLIEHGHTGREFTPEGALLARTGGWSY